MIEGMYHRMLTNPEANTKTKRSSVPIYSLGLAPHTAASTKTVCPNSTQGCREVCLHYQGRSRVFKQIVKYRIAKTRSFHDDEDGFMRRLARDVLRVPKGCAIRLNAFSDIDWTTDRRSWIFRARSDLQFFDYTKSYKRMLRFLARDSDKTWPQNYYLTFSRSERNHDECMTILAAGGCVTVVHDGSKPLPYFWYGAPVIDGDLDDARFKDPPGRWVALTMKGRGDDLEVAKRSGFAVTFP